jgi:multiple sugar transport system permease protein
MRPGVKHGLLFIGPFLLVYILFVLVPVIQAVYMSLHNWDLLGTPPRWIGFDNFERMLWGTEMTWNLSHLGLARAALVVAAAAVAIRAALRRRLTTGVSSAIIGLVALAVVMGIHPGSGGLWNDPGFWTALQNTLVFTAVSTPIIAGLGLIMALSLQGNRRGTSIYQMAFFLPYVLPVSVVTLVWTFFLSPNAGILAPFLAQFGIEPIAWLGNPNFALAGIILTTVWWTVGFNLVLFAAGLQDIDSTLYEAAALDGAGRWRQFVSITLPGLNHVMVLVLVTQVIASFQVFGQVNIMTGGGPGDATRVLVQHVYEAGFRDLELGYASAVSLFLFAVMALVSIIQFRVIARDN